MPTCVVISLRQCVDVTINQINVKEYDYIRSGSRSTSQQHFLELEVASVHFTRLITRAQSIAG
jgi:hypothetical protein